MQGFGYLLRGHSLTIGSDAADLVIGQFVVAQLHILGPQLDRIRFVMGVVCVSVALVVKGRGIDGVIYPSEVVAIYPLIVTAALVFGLRHEGRLCITAGTLCFFLYPLHILHIAAKHDTLSLNPIGVICQYIFGSSRTTQVHGFTLQGCIGCCCIFHMLHKGLQFIQSLRCVEVVALIVEQEVYSHYHDGRSQEKSQAAFAGFHGAPVLFCCLCHVDVLSEAQTIGYTLPPVLQGDAGIIALQLQVQQHDALRRFLNRLRHQPLAVGCIQVQIKAICRGAARSG